MKTHNSVKKLAVKNRVVEVAFVVIQSVPVIAAQAVPVRGIESFAHLIGQQAVPLRNVVPCVALLAVIVEIAHHAIRIFGFGSLFYASRVVEVIERRTLDAQSVGVVEAVSISQETSALGSQHILRNACFAESISIG